MTYDHTNTAHDHDLAGAAANAAYDAVKGEHLIDWDNSDRAARQFKCICGRTFRTPQGRGLHVAAEDRNAWRAWHGEYDRVLMLARTTRSIASRTQK